MLCSACKRENSSDARFCSGCGQRFEAPAAHESGEKRPLTILFCDMVDSVKLAASLDQEDWRSIVMRYHAVCSSVIEAHRGLVRQYLGDGVLAYFGFPSAGEQDAVNAARAGLLLIERVRSLAAEVEADYDVRLAVRVGIHSGLVVLSETGRGAAREKLAFGSALNVASRLQDVAEPNTVAIGSATRRLIEGLFVVEALGKRELKGLPGRVDVFRIERREDVLHRLDATSPRGLSRFVGRRTEIDRLLQAWDEAKAGSTRILSVRGEPGVGKSRLLREVREKVRAVGGHWLQGRCLVDGQETPFSPLRRMLRQAWGLETASDPERALGILETVRRDLDLDPAVVERLAQLAGVTATPFPESARAERRRQTIEALMEWLRAEARRAPIAVAIEDLHWADPSTREVLTFADRELAGSRLALLLTTRPTAPLDLHGATQLTLPPLGAQESRELALALGGGDLEPSLLESLVERGAGLPLFLEELLRDQRNAPSRSAGVPASIMVSLAARLDQLGPARGLAQTAAVIGGEIPLELLVRLSGGRDTEVLEQASELVECGLGAWIDRSEGPRFQFKHDLMADAAYDSLLKTRRRELHAAVATELDTPRERRLRPERIARHLELAEDYPAAVHMWRRAGQKAARAHALAEAGAHFARAVACFRRAGGSLGPAAEFQLRSAQLEYLNMRYGFTGTPQLDVLARLAELTESEHLDDLQRFAAFQWLTARSSAGTDVAESNRWADRAEELADRTGDKRIVIGMGSTVGMARLLSGRYEDARRVAETALDAMGGRGNPSPDSPGAGETWAMSLSLLAHAHEAMGNTAEARRCLDEAVQEARRKEPFDPHTLGYVLNFRAVLHLMEDEIALCVENAREMVELATRYEFAQIGASGEQFLACDEMARGDPEAGVDRWERALPQAMPFGHLRLRHVEGIARAGRPGDALRTALSHREVLRAAGEVFCSEELDAFIAQASFECEGDLRASVARFEDVLSEAAAHGAQGPRLRIAHRFARLLGGIGEVEHAIAVLDEALSGFPVPEGSRCHERASALREELRRRAER